MSIHFAAARRASRSPVARALTRRAPGRAANDNAARLPGDADDARVFRAALKHFAAHGLRAADEAGRLADRARREGDQQGSDWWSAIRAKLDPNAERISRRDPLKAIENQLQR